MQEPQNIKLTLEDFENLSAGKTITIGTNTISFESNVTLLKLINICEWHIHNETSNLKHPKTNISCFVQK